MDLTGIAEMLESLSLSTAIRQGMPWSWLFPAILSLHVLAITIVYGSILFFDLRLLGFVQVGTRVSRQQAELIPLTWTAFVFAIITGSILFIANATDYVVSLQFGLKIACILLAGVNMAVFQRGVGRQLAEWDTQLPPPTAARIAGLLSVLFWTSVVFFSKWIAYMEGSAGW